MRDVKSDGLVRRCLENMRQELVRLFDGDLRFTFKLDVWFDVLWVETGEPNTSDYWCLYVSVPREHLLLSYYGKHTKHAVAMINREYVLSDPKVDPVKIICETIKRVSSLRDKS